MSQETIDVGLTPNDGAGDPLRTAFIKCNNNFTQLFATSSLPPRIANGATSVNIPQGDGNVIITVNGTPNIATFTQSGSNITGAFSATGNIRGANLRTIGIMSAAGNVIGGNILSDGAVQAAGNIDGGNVNAGANVYATTHTGVTASVSGNVNAGNVFVLGRVSATGNITANTGAFFIGDGGLLSNVTVASNVAVTQIANGTSIIGIAGINGNGTVTVGGNANVVVFATSGQWVNGLVSVTGNVRCGNVISLGSTQTTGNVTGGNINTGSIVSAAGNVIGGNLVTNGIVLSSGNITGGNILTAGAVSATGNVTGGNVIGVNILTAGAVSATGNVTGSYILGDGSQLTNINVSSIQNSTSNVGIANPGGNVSIAVGGVANVAVYAATGEYITGLISATGNITGGNLSGTNVVGTLTTAAQTNITSLGTLTSLNSGAISSSGNITGANILTGGLISATGNVTAGNLTVSLGTVSLGNIVNNNANGVGNIGSSSKYFNRVFALASSAQYADLAEYYTADSEYEPGTVVKFGGEFEITMSTQDADPEVAGVISTCPAYAMNTGIQGEYTAAVALQGRVPCKVQGPVRKGQMMVSAGNGYARAEIKPEIGTVIGKALENFSGDQGVIEVVVGRV